MREKEKIEKKQEELKASCHFIDEDRPFTMSCLGLL